MSDDFSYLPGDKCFAKVKGFPYWPARINCLPPDVKVPKGKYPIFFYGTHEVCFLPKAAICSYEKCKDKFGGSRNSNNFNKGIKELENNGTIFELGEDSKALNFLSQFYEFSLPKARSFLRSLKSQSDINSQPDSSKTTNRKSKKSIKTNNSVKLELAKTNKSVANSEGFSEQETESKSSLEANTSNPSLSINLEHDLPLNFVVQDRGPIMMIKHEFSDPKVENAIKIIDPINNENSNSENNATNVDKSEIVKDSLEANEVCVDSPTKADSILNETLSTICMGDLSSDDQMEADGDTNNTENKEVNASSQYIQDFGYLMVQIKKFAWSPERQTEFQRKLKNQKYDSRLRAFFPWYQLPKK